MGSKTLVDRVTRSIVRPVITLVLLAMWLALIWLGKDYPTELQWLTIACTLEWCGERAITRLKELLK